MIRFHINCTQTAAEGSVLHPTGQTSIPQIYTVPNISIIECTMKIYYYAFYLLDRFC